jgi:hypothetical protein
MTWFRREKGVHWLVGFGDDPEIQREALETVRLTVSAVVSGASEKDV